MAAAGRLLLGRFAVQLQQSYGTYLAIFALLPSFGSKVDINFSCRGKYYSYYQYSASTTPITYSASISGYQS